jgi:hypothetical protein
MGVERIAQVWRDDIEEERDLDRRLEICHGAEVWLSLVDLTDEEAALEVPPFPHTIVEGEEDEDLE